MFQRKKTCCFSGHRDLTAEEAAFLRVRLQDAIRYLYGRGVTTFISGGARGFDMLAAEVVIAARREQKDISLILAVPCRDQASKWLASDVARYQKVISQANQTIVLSEHYYDGCMQARNRFMVDNSRFCICWMAKHTGGTAYTVYYAKECGLTVYNLARK